MSHAIVFAFLQEEYRGIEQEGDSHQVQSNEIESRHRMDPVEKSPQGYLFCLHTHQSPQCTF